MLVVWLVDNHLLLLRDFGPHVIIYMAIICCFGILGFMGYYNRCHGNAVKGGQLYTRTVIITSI
jgi:hypothetical protein